MIGSAIKHSIVLVTYNHEMSVRAALDSIMAQTIAPFEVVILDDCSSDRTVEVVANYTCNRSSPQCSYRVVVNEENLGIPKNMVKASQLAGGNVVTIMSGDDAIALDTIETVSEAIRCKGLNPEVDMFVAFSPILDKCPKDVRTIGYRIIADSPIKTMIRKAAPFVKVGFSAALMKKATYPHTLGIWADWVWDVDLCIKANNYYEISKPCYLHTALGGVSTMTGEEQIQRSYLQAAECILSQYKYAISVSERLYLWGEIFYLRGQLDGSSGYKVIGFFLAVMNFWNLGGMVGFKSVAARYLPLSTIKRIRKILA